MTMQAVGKEAAEAVPMEGSRLWGGNVAALAGALAKAQGEIKSAAKDHTAEVKSDKGNYQYGYATLAGVWDACRDPLSKNGLAVIQVTQMVGHEMVLYTRLVHSEGGWIGSEYPIRPTKNDPQGVGSALTYARRYSLSALVGVAPDDDDDGAAASVGGAERPAAPRRAAAAEKPAPQPGAIDAGRKVLRDATDEATLKAAWTSLSPALQKALAAEKDAAKKRIAEGAAPPRDKPSEEREQPPASDLPTCFGNFGQSKGQPIAGASERDLDYYADAARKSLEDPAKAQWHPKDRLMLAAIEAEQRRIAEAA